jgi:hypothetical protein
MQFESDYSTPHEGYSWSKAKSIEGRKKQGKSYESKTVKI